MILKDLLKNIDITNTNADLGMDITGVSDNSVNVQPGDLFAAIKGYSTDGHGYIGDAVKKGAACILCREKPNIETPYIITPDCRVALALISGTWFGNPADKIKVIGVTGTNGKTTVTHLIKHIIEKCSGRKAGLIGTIGNLIGERELAAKLTTPGAYELHSTLAKMVLEGCEYAVMEVSSHALYLNRVYGIEFETGVFTNLTPDHLDFHPSMDEYAKAKAILFKNCRSSVINTDDAYAGLMIRSSKGKAATYSVNDKDAGITAENVKLHPGKTEFDAIISGTAGGSTVHVTIHIPGMFSVYNALAALSTGISLGYKADDICKALFSCPGVKGRAEAINIGGDYTVLLDYAHTPDALKNILETARSVAKERVVAVFGCGGDRDKFKRPAMGKIAALLADVVYVTSDNPRTEEPGSIIDEILSEIPDKEQMIAAGKLCVIENRKDAICSALDNLNKGDLLVVAGKGHEDYQIIGQTKIHFDDREVVQEHIRQARESKRKGKIR